MKLRLITALLSAALLPLVLFVSLQTAFSAETERADFEKAAIDDARRVSTGIDARLERTRGAAGVLVTTNAVLESDWPAARERMMEIVEQNPDWQAAVIWDRRTGRSIIDTQVPFGLAMPRRAFNLDTSKLEGPSDLVTGGISLEGDLCPCVFVHTSAGPGRPYVLTVSLFPSAFQEVVERESHGTLATTLVDGAGKVIATSLGPQARIGRPASEFGALAGRRSGIYRGATSDGRRHFSAFWVSPLSGWSSHVALMPEAIEGTRIRSVAAAAIAALASLVVASAIIALSLRNFAAQRRLEDQANAALRVEATAQLAVARDLHDGVLQFLTGLNLRLFRLRQAIGRGPSPPKEMETAIATLEGEIGREQRELRRFIEGLGPSLKATDPIVSLAATRAMLSRRWSVAVSLSPDSADELVPPELKRDIGFIVREAVSNAVRHGGARNVDVEIERDRHLLGIVIRDDGTGFVREEGAATPGDREKDMPATILGRVSQHGGTLVVRSEAQGATLHIRMPVA